MKKNNSPIELILWRKRKTLNLQRREHQCYHCFVYGEKNISFGCRCFLFYRVLSAHAIPYEVWATKLINSSWISWAITTCHWDQQFVTSWNEKKKSKAYTREKIYTPKYWTHSKGRQEAHFTLFCIFLCYAKCATKSNGSPATQVKR